MNKEMVYPMFLHYLRIIRKRLTFLLGMMASAALVAAVVSFIEPRTYTSKATFLTSIAAGYTPLSSLRISLGAPSTGGISPEVIYHLIESNRMAVGIVEHFREDPRFEVAKDLTIRKAHRMISSFEISQGTLVGVEATSTDPLFSKEVANFCVSYLNTINEQMGLTTDKPMVKLLDAAEVPTGHNPRYTPQKSVATALVVGLLGCLFFTLQDYFKNLKKFTRPLSVEEVLNEEGLTAGKKHS